jgi:hypothetical protein
MGVAVEGSQPETDAARFHQLVTFGAIGPRYSWEGTMEGRPGRL